MKILCVDDEDELRLLVQEQLKSMGFEVDEAGDGDNALQAIDEGDYDLILLDIRMPKMNGIDVLRTIRSQGLPTRVIMLTAVDDLGVAMESIKNGADDYITKPYDIDKLTASIRRLVPSNGKK